jgi:hypothetical protein
MERVSLRGGKRRIPTVNRHAYVGYERVTGSKSSSGSVGVVAFLGVDAGSSEPVPAAIEAEVAEFTAE